MKQLTETKINFETRWLFYQTVKAIPSLQKHTQGQKNDFQANDEYIQRYLADSLFPKVVTFERDSTKIDTVRNLHRRYIEEFGLQIQK